MSKDNFPFFESYYESFKNLPAEVVGQIVLAMGALYFDDVEIELSGIPKAIFELIRPVVDNSKHISESRKAAVNKRWDSKNKESDTNVIQTGYKTDTKPIQTEYKADTEKEKDKEKDKDNISFNPQTPLDRHFEDEKLNEVFLEYLDSRKRQGASCDIERIQRKLFDMGKGNKDTMIQILEQSLTQGWKGLFELKDGKAREPTNRMKNHEERDYNMSSLEAEFANRFLQ